jgi:transposase
MRQRPSLGPAISHSRSCGAADPLQVLKRFVKRKNNDAADTEAICKAAQRPNMRFVPVKTVERRDAR